MRSEFYEFQGFVRDVGIVDKRAVVCIDNQDPKILDGFIERIIFDSQEYQATLITTIPKLKSKKIYSIPISHRLFKKLQLMANMSEVPQIHTKDCNI